MKLGSKLQSLVTKLQSAMKIYVNKKQTGFPRSGMHRGRGELIYGEDLYSEGKST